MLVIDFSLAIAAEIEPLAQDALISRANNPELIFAV
jgi:hypothetical protein